MDIRGLVHQLGYEQVSVVGHDIGLIVAYAYAAQSLGWVGGEHVALSDTAH